ncbi:hypothetical protein ACTJI8_12795 [Microbacterium sp. 22303]|uniref:hypothetical protein n=1 Tax=Microbacterium sp. 22303 TaxID=3453905 RepID=UPI003F83C4D8
MLRIQAERATILGHPDPADRRPAGLFVGRDGFQGWDDTPDAVREAIARAGAHGEYDLPVFQAARVFSVDGHAIAWSDQTLDNLHDIVTGVGAAGGRFQVTVTHRGQPLRAFARRGGKALFQDLGFRTGRRRASFQLQFVAADPRKYGEEHSFHAGAEVFHRGNFPASPVLEVTGPTPAYTIGTSIGRSLTIGQSLSAGQVHRIELRTGRLYRNGVLQTGAITAGGMWAVPPGIPGVVHTITGPGTLLVRLTDTYI